MQFDLNLLTALDALLQEQSVTGAAERLHLSVPAMSRTLGRIRIATGDLILVRSGRRMTPTPRALELREEVRALVLRSSEVLTPRRDFDVSSLSRTFTFRTHDALTRLLAPALVRHASEYAPGVTLRFLSESVEDTPDLRRGVVEFEIGSAVPRAPDIEQEHLGDDQLVAVARNGHPLLHGDLDLARFAGFAHIVVSRRGRLRDGIDDALERAGHPRTVVAALASTMAAIAVAQTTDAVLVLPRSVAAHLEEQREIAILSIPLALPSVPIVLAWNTRFTADRGHRWMREMIRSILAPSATGLSEGAARDGTLR